MNNKWLAILTLSFSLFFASKLSSQNWEFIKEKDGIKIFTKKEATKKLKITKGVTEIKGSADKVFKLLEDVNSTEWWDENISKIKVLHYEKNKKAQYYLAYDMPWPFKDRDLTVDVISTFNKTTGEYKLLAVPSKDRFPENKDLVRIKDYRQEWTVRPLNNRTYIELEFYIDPNENFPTWLLNMVLIDSPVNTIKSAKRVIEK